MNIGAAFIAGREPIHGMTFHGRHPSAASTQRVSAMLFTIDNPDTGVIIGAYEGASAVDALATMAREAGFANYAELNARAPTKPGELRVEPTGIRLEPVAADPHRRAVFLRDELVGHIHQRPDSTTFLPLGGQRTFLGRASITDDLPATGELSCSELLAKVANIVLRDRNASTARQWMTDEPVASPSEELPAPTKAVAKLPLELLAPSPQLEFDESPVGPRLTATSNNQTLALTWTERVAPLWADIEAVLAASLTETKALPPQLAQAVAQLRKSVTL